MIREWHEDSLILCVKVCCFCFCCWCGVLGVWDCDGVNVCNDDNIFDEDGNNDSDGGGNGDDGGENKGRSQPLACVGYNDCLTVILLEHFAPAPISSFSSVLMN